MSRFLTAKPPQLGTFSQYSGLDTSSSSLLSHASSLFDKITPTSTTSVEGSPTSTPLPSPFEEKGQSDLVTMEVDLSAEVPISPFDPDFDMTAVEDGDEEVYSSVMPLIDYAPDHSVDIDAITPESMEMVMRLQALGCQLDAGTILNNIASAKGDVRASARTGAGYDLGSLRSEPPRDVDWLAFIETVVRTTPPLLLIYLYSSEPFQLPNVNTGKVDMGASSVITSNTPPPPAPRLRPTQLPDDDIPEMSSLYDSFPATDTQISDFAASLKAAAAVHGASAASRGVQAVATPASMLFGGTPEPVSMQVPMSAFGFPGGSPRGFSTPKQSEQTPSPTRGCVGNDGDHLISSCLT